jgi:hypothetical protein
MPIALPKPTEPLKMHVWSGDVRRLKLAAAEESMEQDALVTATSIVRDLVAEFLARREARVAKRKTR